MQGPQGLEDGRGGVVLQPAPGVQQQQRRRRSKVELNEQQRQRQPQHSAWVSPYLRRKGHHVSTSRPAQRTALKLNARARLQQKTLLLLEERELLDPGANNLLFVGANAQTNVMAVMMLQEAGYNVRTVVSLDELRTISARDGRCDPRGIKGWAWPSAVCTATPRRVPPAASVSAQGASAIIMV